MWTEIRSSCSINRIHRLAKSCFFPLITVLLRVEDKIYTARAASTVILICRTFRKYSKRRVVTVVCNFISSIPLVFVSFTPLASSPFFCSNFGFVVERFRKPLKWRGGFKMQVTLFESNSTSSAAAAHLWTEVVHVHSPGQKFKYRRYREPSRAATNWKFERPFINFVKYSNSFQPSQLCHSSLKLIETYFRPWLIHSFSPSKMYNFKLCLIKLLLN